MLHYIYSRSLIGVLVAMPLLLAVGVEFVKILFVDFLN